MKNIIYTLLISLFVWGCKQKEKITPPTPEKAMEIRNAIIEWMECEECDANELENVTKHGDIVINTLAEILEGGPSPSKRVELTNHLASTYDELFEYQKNHPEAKIAMTKDEYVKTYMENYQALYRTRAAIALGRFNSPTAKEALKKAIGKQTLRMDVTDAIQQALEGK